jgi:NAD(P)-dependent dehydrogenase (short-subunit alcohol dehydrogenase family)
MRPIDQQTILITGATGGLGWELVRATAEQGATLLLHGRDPQLGREIVRDITETTGNKNIRFLRADLSSLQEVNELAQQVSSSLSRLDVLERRLAELSQELTRDAC